MSVGAKLRCAVYTRKSSEEGLDQEFNSLDAQREACAAFIASQVGLGWKLVNEHYDDGGISGGTMERPALQRLLQDIRDRKIDVVVVYKIDRLTRSLTDFARIVEVFDKSDISFVSVTQQFNTTTSMGRLTLNVLLSFAQFEREVTAERIRDKIAASKKKGMWMGGTVPLGYRVESRKLLVKEPEAGFVRGLFDRYLELRSVPALAAEVTRQAVAAEQHEHLPDEPDANSVAPTRYVRRVGSGMLYKLLANPLYIGKLKHRQNVYDGEHQAIVNPDRFAQVQELLVAQAATPRGSCTHPDAQLLTGLLYDDSGDRMSPTHARARGKRFHYYISSRIKGTKRTDSTAWRIPAPAIDALVVKFMIRLLGDRVQLSEWIRTYAPASSVQAAIDRAKSVASTLADVTMSERRNIIETLFPKIVLGIETITFKVDAAALARLLSPAEGTPISACQPAMQEEQHHQDGPHQPIVEINLPIRLKRRGNEMRLVIEGENQSHNPDPHLVRMVASAHIYLERMIENPELGTSGVAEQFGIHRVDVGRVLPLAFLAPRLIDQILSGNQSADLSARQLARQDLPLLWSEQLAALS
ncbi:recombinase family protein [Mesorhizobium sp. 10J20-29]